MSTLADLLAAHTDLRPGEVEHLQLLVGEWQMLSDLSFSDLLMVVPDRDSGRFVVVAQARPATAPTAHLEDEVGRVRQTAEVVAAWDQGRVLDTPDTRWSSGVPVRAEAIPVRCGDRVVAVIARDTNLSAVRTPSPLEIAYLRTAQELGRMVAEGRFPFPGGPTQSSQAARVGDGLIRLDEAGEVTYASPNAQSVYRRMGHIGNLAGQRLDDLLRPFPRSGAGPRLDSVLTSGVPAEEEIDTRGAVVRFRAIPLVSGGVPQGAVVLVREVTEVRRREQQLLGKDAMIREIHHRVKNNLQTVAALLRLQARRTEVPEAQAALQESVRRVTAIALVHETLSQTLDEAVHFDGIVDELISMTIDVSATGRRPVSRRTGSFGLIPGGLATALALVLSELMQNAVEHAFAEGGETGEPSDDGSVQVRVHRDAAGMQVVVADDGAGLPDGFHLEDAARLGLRIACALVEQEMRGTLELRPNTPAGTQAVVTIPAEVLSVL